MPEQALRQYAVNANRETPDANRETPAGFSAVFDGFTVTKADRTGADILVIDLARRASITPKKYPLWDITQNGIPISAVVSYEDDNWFAEIDWLNVVGTGESPNDAVHDLEAHIIYFMGFYQNQAEDELTRYANELKTQFATLVHIY